MKKNIDNLRHAHFFTYNLPIAMGKDQTKDGDATTSTETNRDHSRDREARYVILAKTIAEAVARETQSIAEVFTREMAKAHVQYQEAIKENGSAALPTTLKVTSG